MISIFIFFFISSILTVSIGNLFLRFIYRNPRNYIFSFSEEGIFGLIFISFISLSLNFIFKLDQTVATILFIFPLFYLFQILQKKNFDLLKKLFFHSLIISLIATIFISFDNVNRPDGGIYHLPYIKIINEFKIFTGSANLNPLFGATSIFQYTSAIYNNIIFKDLGITIPNALIGIYCIDYFFRNFFSKKNDKDYFYKLFIFGVSSYFLIEMNRYSDYGNDTPAHLYFFYLISLFLKKNFSLQNNQHFKIFALVSLFCFINRPFLVISIFLAIYVWIKNKHYSSWSSFPIFSLFFFIFWVTKNILVSGCAIYPVTITCIDTLPWYSNDAKFRVSSRNSSEFSELHAKGWKDIMNNKDYQNYEVKTEEKQLFLRSFNWLDKNYILKHSYTFKKKVDFFILYLFLVCLFIYVLKDNKENLSLSTTENRNTILFLISAIGLVIMIYKFPLGRYGTSYLSIFTFCLLFPLIKFVIKKSSTKRNNLVLSVFLLILTSVFFFKNINRSIKNYSANYHQSPWPRIYDNSFDLVNSSKKQNQPVKFEKINKNNLLDIYYIDKGNFYTSQRKILCLYNKAPCTQTSENFDTFEIEIKKGYYLVRLNKN